MNDNEAPKAMTREERELEGIAMNIVHQIGDVLYDALPKDVAHDHFVTARQKTNGMAIDFAKLLIGQYASLQERESLIKALEGGESYALKRIASIQATINSNGENKS